MLKALRNGPLTTLYILYTERTEVDVSSAGKVGYC